MNKSTLLVLLLAAIAILTACGGRASALSVAQAYLLSDTPEERASLFTDDATYTDSEQKTYAGRESILQRLRAASEEAFVGDLLESPHQDGDHVTWVRVTFLRRSYQLFQIRQNIWVEQGRIVRFLAQCEVGC
jgi:hypothetical protein